MAQVVDDKNRNTKMRIGSQFQSTVTRRSLTVTMMLVVVLAMLTNDVSSFVIPRTFADTSSRSIFIDNYHKLPAPTSDPSLDMVASSHASFDSIPQPESTQRASKRARLKDKLSTFRKKPTDTTTTKEDAIGVESDGDGDAMIRPGHDGIYHISNEEQHK